MPFKLEGWWAIYFTDLLFLVKVLSVLAMNVLFLSSIRVELNIYLTLNNCFSNFLFCRGT
nr:MAG TPA: hypothetical protein [Caudoviricetes sp.]